MNRFRRPGQRGVTLIEMMVALLVGSLLVIATLIVLAGQVSTTPGSQILGAETTRRTQGSSSDLDQAAAIAMFQIDKWVRSAGTGFASTITLPICVRSGTCTSTTIAGLYSYAYGCQIFAATSSGTQLLPLPSGTSLGPFGTGATFPNTTTPGVLRLLPALIVPGATSPNMTNMISGSPHTSDALVLMSSGNGYGEGPVAISAVSTAAGTPLTLPNTMAFSGANVNDLALLAHTDTSSSIQNCMVTQAALVSPTDGTATTLPLGGAWYAATIGTQAVSSYASTGVVLDMGDPTSTSTQPPSFQVVGVGDNDTLYSYDLLGVKTPQLQSRGEDVFELHALYGIDNVGDDVIHTWVSPTTTGYTVADLTAGTVAAAQTIRKIKALRIGLILRTDLPEKSAVKASSSASVSLFQPLIDATEAPASVLYTRTFTGAETYYRYRTVEATIPVRNGSYAFLH